MQNKAARWNKTMTSARTFFFFLSGCAFISALGVTGYAMYENSSGPGMGPFVAILWYLPWITPATNVGITSLLIGFILRKKVQQRHWSTDPVQQSATNAGNVSFGRSRFGLWTVRIGLAYAALAVMFKLYGVYTSWTDLSGEFLNWSQPAIRLSVLISSVGAAIPGLVICLIGTVIQGKEA